MQNRDGEQELTLRALNEAATAEYYKNKCDELEKKCSGTFAVIGRRTDRFIRKYLSVDRYVKNYKIRKGTVNFNREGLNTTDQRERKIIASLTSYPGRINCVPGTLASLMNQTYKLDKIVLWLGEEKFPDRKLPPIFDEFQKCGVEIVFQKDLKSHTKYFYAMQKYPEDVIITVDDDLDYRSTLVEELVTSYKKYPNNISALRVHKMRFNDDTTPKPYREWIYEYSGEIGSASHQYFATGVGGVLYPPHILHSEVFNLEAIQEYCHNHDDLWLKIMGVMNGVKVVLAADSKKESGDMIIGSQITGQWHENVVAGGNDRQTEAVLGMYNNWLDSGKTLTEIMAFDMD